MLDLDDLILKIAAAFEAAGALIMAERLRALTRLSGEGTRGTWLLTLREATVEAIDNGVRVSRLPLNNSTAEAMLKWRNVARALDTHGAEIAMALGALDAVETAPVVKRRAA